MERQRQPSLGGGAAVLEPTQRGTRDDSMRLLSNKSEEVVVPTTPKQTVVQKPVPVIEVAPPPAPQPVQQAEKPTVQAPASPVPEQPKSVPVVAQAPMQPVAPYVEPKPKEALALSQADSAKAIGIVSRLEAQLRSTPQHQSKNRRSAKERAVQEICAVAGLTVTGAAGFSTAMGVLKRCENGSEAMKLFQQLMSKQ